MKKLIAGNWKMNGTVDEAKILIADIVNGIHEEPALVLNCEFLVCPSFLHIASIRHTLKPVNTMSFGAQDCSEHDDGAYTGDVSAKMLADSECVYVILGHSERRQHHAEKNTCVARKAKQAHEQGLITIICVGETEKERDEGKEKQVIAMQLSESVPPNSTAKNTVIAYEPVWAIGTGKTALPEDVKDMHAFIRNEIKTLIKNPDDVRILYGGSLKPQNAAEILATENVNGGLIGGASLKADDFLAIARAVESS